MKTMITTLAALAILGGAAAAQEGGADKRILVFGDSLTWGWVPTDPIVPTERHATEDLWTSAMGDALGEGYEIIVEGLSGRTTNIDDPNDPKLNGAEILPTLLASHEPLDLVIIMLGTNDTKTYLERTPLEIGLGMGELVNQVHEAPGWDWTDYEAPDVLVVSPPPLGEEIDDEAQAIFDEASKQKSAALAQVYASIAEMAGEHSFAAGSVVETDGVDGIYFTAETNAALGEAVAAEVERILAE